MQNHRDDLSVLREILDDERNRTKQNKMNNRIGHYMHEDSDEECLAMFKRTEQPISMDNEHEEASDDEGQHNEEDEEEKENSYSSNNIL